MASLGDSNSGSKASKRQRQGSDDEKEDGHLTKRLTVAVAELDKLTADGAFGVNSTSLRICV
jgi:hypothetical protein